MGSPILGEGRSTFVTTASDVIRVFKVELDLVKAGPIELRNVDAVVMEGEQPHEALLGMSFLGQLQMSNEGNELILRRRY